MKISMRKMTRYYGPGDGAGDTAVADAAFISGLYFKLGRSQDFRSPAAVVVAPDVQAGAPIGKRRDAGLQCY